MQTMSAIKNGANCPEGVVTMLPILGKQIRLYDVEIPEMEHLIKVVRFEFEKPEPDLDKVRGSIKVAKELENVKIMREEKDSLIELMREYCSGEKTAKEVEIELDGTLTALMVLKNGLKKARIYWKERQVG